MIFPADDRPSPSLTASVDSCIVPPVPLLPTALRRCIYCGGDARLVSCPGHVDLLELDPHRYLVVELERELLEAVSL